MPGSVSSPPLSPVIVRERVPSSSGSDLIQPHAVLKISILIFALVTILGIVLVVLSSALGALPSLVLTVSGCIAIAVGLIGLGILVTRLILSTIRKVDAMGYDAAVKEEQYLSRIRELESENREIRDRNRAVEDQCAHLSEENKDLRDPEYLHGMTERLIASLEIENQALVAENILLKDWNASLSRDFRAYKQKFPLGALEPWKEDIACIMEQNLFLKPECIAMVKSLPLETQRLFLYPKGFQSLVNRFAPRSRFFQTPKYEYNSRNENEDGKVAAVCARLKKEFFSAVLGACSYEELGGICERAVALKETLPLPEAVYDTLVQEFPNLLTAESLWKEWCFYSYPYLRPYLSVDYCKRLFVQLFEELCLKLFTTGSPEDQALVRLFSYYRNHIPAVLASFGLPPPETGGSVFVLLPKQENLLWSQIEVLATRYLKDTFVRNSEWTGSFEMMFSYNEMCKEISEGRIRFAEDYETRHSEEFPPSPLSEEGEGEEFLPPCSEEEVSVLERPDLDVDSMWVWHPPVPKGPL
ncbi:hypothetical protein [Chlamydia pneumoniae]|uniref:Uncharacterized protein n=1 Tax=Chlamydia pneumoniae TaxID=83558 RepID=A0A0F7WRH6_CHLPN|nr:hypothetical protein [Chlamydia pneumoniae]AAD19164.1 hypothetical protein CPn_1027 [Chlamydia pneumoniae CWL029]CRI33570.1 Uncharacterized protein BN1224_Wien1_A_10770 [Chlamydia pneumoniae]CRI37559.1 Uncharacterized protein BN1224_CV14_A_10780 [Chlamydia pneumoniae]CRI38691.1 Uncharacterized protein BN1224_CV15_C_05240 [Chlamydia pneumoniae]CRI39822.1 Uncharacterized protein BN1224_CWL011_A_10860 [Chlamydia pneumoniae]